LNTRRFIKFLSSYNPQIIISTHFLASELAFSLKKINRINSRLITIVTDFDVHPFWVLPGTDAYMVASEYTKKELVFSGIKENSIRITGIPVDLKFSEKYDKGFFCKKLGVQNDRFTVLIVTAAFGLGPIEKIVDLLHKDVQVLVVCGKNKRLRHRLTQKSYAAVKIFGFVENIEELMAVSDVIITKPGGLTTSESLSMGLPMIFISAIYGQETKNATILENYGAGITPPNLKALMSAVLDFRNNPYKLKQIRERINKVKKPYAVKEICECCLPS
jgi:processive 1,2-diacylglycerol beta-glucosyltransferase